MKIRRLDMKAFGPFTDVSLEFDSKMPGLHIIFGPNEAGKSSSLRALKALLFGFHDRTADNFVHANEKLLVGGFLENNDGRTITFQRRKKRKGDIVDINGDPLDSNVLVPFLHGMEQDIFDSLYGIDHDTLVQGGRDILDQKGEVGQALFAAGAGISSLREVIEQLEKEAENLFKPTGQLPEINKAAKTYKELQKEAKEASLSSNEWKTHQKALKEAEDERIRLERERIEKNKELHRLERLRQAIPEIGSLGSLQSQLRALGHITPLPPDFSHRYQQVSQEIREVGLRLEKDTDRLNQLKQKRKTIQFNENLLSEADLVDDLHQRLGEYRKAQKDRPQLNGMRISLRTDAASLLKQVRSDLSLDDVETLRPMLSKKRTLQTLSNKYESISDQLILAEKQLKESEKELKETQDRLASVPEPPRSEHLMQAVKLAQKAGQIDEQLKKGISEVSEERKRCLSTLMRLGMWTGELTDLKALPLPLPETVKQFEKGFSDIDEERRSLDKDRKKVKKELTDARAELRKVAYAGEVPSEDELIQTREKRQQGWQLLRRQWLDQEDVSPESEAYEPGQPLPDAYEKQVDLADLIADRLRREADRVANAASLRARIESLEAYLSEYDKNINFLDERKKELDASWIEVWRHLEIEPLSPKEMSTWLAEMDKLTYKVDAILKKEQEISQDSKRRSDLREKLLKELSAVGEAPGLEDEALGPVLVSAEAVLDRIAKEKASLEKLKERGENAEKALFQAGDQLKAAQESMAKWEADWKKAISGFGFTEAISTAEALDMLDVLQSCFDKLKDAGDRQKRIDGIDHDAKELEKEVHALAEKVAVDISALPVEQAILKLRDMLKKAQDDSTLYSSVSEEIESLEAEVTAAEKTLKNANEQLDELLAIAKCDKPEDIAETISRHNQYTSLQEKISDAKATIGRIGEGVPIEEIVRQAGEVNADELPGLIASLKDDIDKHINPEITRLSQVIGEEKTKLSSMDGSAKAAEAAERMEQELAKIRRLAERYIRVKLASRILHQEIERYREKHQDPVLKLASKYFGDLTLGSFSGLRADVNDKGEPILVGVRPDGTRVDVGGMSGGSRDQLYLALRLATLELRLEKSEPIPFIVDDILINFDDDRSKATLKAMADLSEKNQVILFTHHGRIVEQAGKIENGVVHIHEL